MTTGTFTTDAVVVRWPKHCLECNEPLTFHGGGALCRSCCGHPNSTVVFDDARDGANGRMHWDCMSCLAEVAPSEPDEDGDYWFEAVA